MTEQPESEPPPEPELPVEESVPADHQGSWVPKIVLGVALALLVALFLRSRHPDSG